MKRTYIVQPLHSQNLEIKAEYMETYGESIVFFNKNNLLSIRSTDYVATFPKGTTVYEKTCAKSVKQKKK